MRTLPRRAALLLAAILVLAACGDDPIESDDIDDPAALDEADDEDAPDDADGPDDAEPDDGDPAGDVTVGVADTDLGEVLVDGDGLTLYAFDPDEQGESTCYDECATNWPPLVGAEPAAGDGADDALLGTTTRDDGETQVTYDGWPLYHWIGDGEPGDVEGQGVQGVWWVLSADGQPQRDTMPGDGEEDDDASPGGY